VCGGEGEGEGSEGEGEGSEGEGEGEGSEGEEWVRVVRVRSGWAHGVGG
jgi:hypothetical protein